MPLTPFLNIVFNPRRQSGSGPTCCVGPVRQRRSGQEHHHHRASTGSQTCREEGELKKSVYAREYSQYADMMMMMTMMSHLKHRDLLKRL